MLVTPFLHNVDTGLIDDFKDEVEDKWFSDDEEEPKIESKVAQTTTTTNKALVDYQDSDSDSEEKEPTSTAESGS